MYSFFIFPNTSLVFKSEKLLKDNNIVYKVVPTPKSFGKAFCGVCICVNLEAKDDVKRILDEENVEYYIR
jgi:hypothetical protein